MKKKILFSFRPLVYTKYRRDVQSMGERIENLLRFILISSREYVSYLYKDNDIQTYRIITSSCYITIVDKFYARQLIDKNDYDYWIDDSDIELVSQVKNLENRLDIRSLYPHTIVCDEIHRHSTQRHPKHSGITPFSQKPDIVNVIYNDPATIVFWSDGTKTVVKTQDGEPYDPEKGLSMAVSKKYFGNKGNYYNEFKKWLPEEEENDVSFVDLVDFVRRAWANASKTLSGHNVKSYAYDYQISEVAEKMKELEHGLAGLKFMYGLSEENIAELRAYFKKEREMYKGGKEE